MPPEMSFECLSLKSNGDAFDEQFLVGPPSDRELGRPRRMGLSLRPKLSRQNASRTNALEHRLRYADCAYSSNSTDAGYPCEVVGYLADPVTDGFPQDDLYATALASNAYIFGAYKELGEILCAACTSRWFSRAGQQKSVVGSRSFWEKITCSPAFSRLLAHNLDEPRASLG